MAGPEVYVDTSAIFAALVGDDQHNESACQALRVLRAERATLISSSFVVQELVALLQNRVGLQGVRDFHFSFLPRLQVVWINQDQYLRTATALLAANRRRVSLTDWCGFDLMRERSIKRAFAFDRHFEQQGFELIPAPPRAA